MTQRLYLIALALPTLSCAAADSPPDRLIFSVNGSTITHADNGVGGSATWVHPLPQGSVLSLGAEHQQIADSRWTFGSLGLSGGWGESGRRTTLYAEGHAGSGNDGIRPFDYGVYAVGAMQALGKIVTLQLEDRQIDIARTHGNLPKVGLQLLPNPHFLATLSYANSVHGNLGTHLGTARADFSGRIVNLIVGGAGGKASPDIVNLHGLLTPGQTLREGFLGVGKTVARTDWTLLGDYLKIGTTERITLTLNFAVQLAGT